MRRPKNRRNVTLSIEVFVEGHDEKVYFDRMRTIKPARMSTWTNSSKVVFDAIEGLKEKQHVHRAMAGRLVVFAGGGRMIVNEVVKNMQFKTLLLRTDNGKDVFYGTQDQWLESNESKTLRRLKVVRCISREHNGLVYLLVKRGKHN